MRDQNVSYFGLNVGGKEGRKGRRGNDTEWRERGKETGEIETGEGGGGGGGRREGGRET